MLRGSCSCAIRTKNSLGYISLDDRSLRNRPRVMHGTAMKRLKLMRVFGVCALCAFVLSGLSATVARASSGADFNNDNSVDKLDLVKWNADYGTASTPAGGDFLAWQSEAGTGSSPQAEVAANPEPATIVVWGTLAAVAGLGIAARRRRELSA
jgi:hypothetical protein